MLHANYMIKLGARKAIYFLDCPEFYSEDEIQTLSKVASVILCDKSYWEHHTERPINLPDRQLKNIAFARSKINAEWFFHIDIDEFPFIPNGVDRLIDSMAPDVSEIHIGNVERILVQGAANWHTGILRLPSTNLKKQRAAYGNTTAFLGNGLAEYYQGKSIVKNKRNLVQLIHGSTNLRYGLDVIRYNPPISQTSVFHYSCISRAHFIQRIKSKTRSLGGAEEKAFKLRHQYALEAWLLQSNDIQKSALHAFRLLYTCSNQQKQDWIELGLCTNIPEVFTRAIESAASCPEELQLAYADATFIEFYARY